jgi:hypothetical protein
MTKKDRKEYARAYYLANKERIKKKQEENKEYISSYAKEYYIKNKEEIRKKQKNYTDENKESLKAYKLRNKENIKTKLDEYRKINKEKIAKQEKEYKEANSEHIRQKSAEYRAKNVDKKRQVWKEWSINNKEKILANNAKRRAGRLQRTPSWLTADQLQQIEWFYAEAKRLSEETGIKHHVDHVLPLQGKNVSGLHISENLQILTARENIRKSNRYVGA